MHDFKNIKHTFSTVDVLFIILSHFIQFIYYMQLNFVILAINISNSADILKS